MHTVTPARREKSEASPKGSADWTESSSPTEVFDIGHDSEEEDGFGPISSARRSLNVEGALAPEKPWAPWADRHDGRSPDSGVGEGSTAPSSISKAAVERLKERADVWTVEDWEGQLARLKEAPTPCRVPDDADAKQKQVADAVRAELQVDLEALVNAAMDEMRSWVSQEVAFARSSFREEAQKFITSQGEISEIKSKLKENEQLLEKLAKDFQEGRPIKREEEPRASTSSERVAEARAVAEERKWRLRLEQIEQSITRSAEDLAHCQRKISDLEDRHSSNDAELQKGLSSIQAADVRMSDALKEMKQLRQSSEMQVEQLHRLEKQQEICASQMDLLKAKQEEHLSEAKHLVISQQEATASLSELRQRAGDVASAQRQQKEEILSLTTSLREMQGITAACRSESLSLDRRMDSALTRLQEVSLQVMKQEEQAMTTGSSVQTLLSDWQSCKDGVARSIMRLDHQQEALDNLNNRRCAMESRVTRVEEEVLQKFQHTDGEVAQNEQEIQRLQAVMETHGERLEDLRNRHGMQEERLRHVESTGEEIETKATKDREELGRLCDAVAQQGQRIEVTCLEATEQSKLMAAFIDRLEKQEGSLQRLEESCSTSKHESENLQEQLDALKDGMMSSQQQLRQLEEQSATLLEQVKRYSLQSEEMRKMQNDLESVLEDSGKWREAMDRMELAINTNVSKEELKQMHGELQTWITDTRQALDRWLSISLERFQKEQGYILQRNLGSVQRVKDWIEEIHIREKGLSHVILHITEQAHPETMRLLEDALKMPRKPNWDVRPDLLWEQ